MIGYVTRWICPACEREFGRARQSHVCVPGCTVEETFAGRPPEQRAVYDALMAYLDTLGPVHADAVRVGVFLKRDRKLAEVRPKARSLSLLLMLPRAIEHPRVRRRMAVSGDRTMHVIRLTGVAEVDGLLRDWLAEAYLAAGPGRE